jgi:hypothetical protein
MTGSSRAQREPGMRNVLIFSLDFLRPEKRQNLADRPSQKIDKGPVGQNNVTRAAKKGGKIKVDT